ncbi:MAG TPA: metal-sensitive transcriptional regulator [Thermoanaerobaculia bacterium]|nr:metal-sensitive transcriptional regulator [Thermoanaerobaculia bacterium]
MGLQARAPRPDSAAELKKKTDVGKRLKRIEGQVRGVQRMVAEDRYCVDVLTQISAIHESLRKVSEILLRDHLSHCVTHAVHNDDEDRREQIYDELADLFNKYAR